jgi:hypothetical protein
MLVSGVALGINTIRQALNNDDKISGRVKVIGDKVTGYDSPSIPKTPRGIICEKNNFDRLLLFQFNPTSIGDSKDNDIISTTDNGFSGGSPMWVKGGDRKLSFRLTFDATAGSNNRFFGKNASPGNPTYDTLDYVKPRGTLDDVDLLSSFQYPSLSDPNTPRFSSGGVVPSARFEPIPIVIFVYGDWYLECIVSSAEKNHILYNEKLIPVRTEVDVSLIVLESEVATQDPRLANYYKTQYNKSLII